MKETKRGLITDFDNTIVKTQDFIKRHLLHTCGRLKLQEPPEDKIETILRQNLPFEQIFTQLFGAEGAKVLEAYRQDAMETPYDAVENAVSLVENFTAEGHKIIIVSNRINKLQERLTQAGFDPNLFLAIIQPEFPKPDQRAYQQAFDSLSGQGVSRENIFILGDSLDDFAACPEDLRNNFFALTKDSVLTKQFKTAGLKEENILSSLQQLPFLPKANGRT